MTSHRRAQRFVWEVEDAQADVTERVPPLGTALRSPSVPHAFDVNLLRVEAPTPLPLDEVVAAAPDHTPYRRLRVEDEATAERLAAVARTTPGWEVDWEVLMLLDPARAATNPALADPPVPPGVTVREGSLDEILTLMQAWYDDSGITGVEQEHCMVMASRAHQATDERRFVAVHEGRPAAMCVVRRGDGVAVPEALFALPRTRGLRLGAALMATALRAAIDEGHDVIACLAEEDDWPRQAYARLGFDVAARRAILQRAPAT